MCLMIMRTVIKKPVVICFNARISEIGEQVKPQWFEGADTPGAQTSSNVRTFLKVHMKINGTHTRLSAGGVEVTETLNNKQHIHS
jgi:hypothetical protein